MSVSYYDKALMKKIQSWIKDKNARVLSPDESLRLFQIHSDNTGDKPITLPLIALSRASNVEINQLHKKPMSFDGLMIGHPDAEEMPERLAKGTAKSLQVNAIPMVLNYQLDIYTKELSTADEYVRNFVFNFVNHPRIELELPYNGVNYKHYCNVIVNSPVQDNSDIPSRLFSGQFYRWSISLTIDDAYLFSVPVENLITIEDVDVEAKFLDEE